MQRHHSRSRVSTSRRGSITVLTVACLLFVIGILAFSIDFGLLIVTESELQNAADAGAFSGARALNDGPAKAIAAAQQWAAKNSAAGESVATVAAEDVEIGNWDKASASFVPNPSGNAVRVTCRRTSARGNPVDLLFARLFGKQDADLTATSIAISASQDCFTKKGAVAGNKLQIGGNFTFDGFCAYGRQRVELGSGGRVRNGAKVGALPGAVIQYSSTEGLPANLYRGDKKPDLANNVATLISNLENKTDLPKQIQFVSVISSWPPAGGVQPHTAYIVNGSVSIKSGTKTVLYNNIIASRGTIAIGEKSDLDQLTCDDSSEYNSGLLATSDIQIGQEASVSGVDLIAGRDVQIGQNLCNLRVGFIQACHDIQLGQAPILSKRGSSVGGSSGGGSPYLVD